MLYYTLGLIKSKVITSQFEHKRHTVVSHVKLSVEFQVKTNRKSSAYHQSWISFVHTIILIGPVFLSVLYETVINPF
jgi:hypothetical protein